MIIEKLNITFKRVIGLFDTRLDLGLNYKVLCSTKDKINEDIYIVDAECTLMSLKGEWEVLNSFGDYLKSARLDIQVTNAAESKLAKEEFALS